MQKTYTLFPIDHDEEKCDDCYCNIRGDYLDQFSLPFLDDYADFIDSKKCKVTTYVLVKNENKEVLFEIWVRPTTINYFGSEEEEKKFDDFLWSHRQLPLTVIINVEDAVIFMAN